MITSYVTVIITPPGATGKVSGVSLAYVASQTTPSGSVGMKGVVWLREMD